MPRSSPRGSRRARRSWRPSFVESLHVGHHAVKFWRRSTDVARSCGTSLRFVDDVLSQVTRDDQLIEGAPLRWGSESTPSGVLRWTANL